MPRIQEYLPEQGAPGPAGGVDPNLEQVAKLGSGIESFGAQTSEAAQMIHHRMAQAETSDAYANVAEARLNFTEEIQDQVQKGTLNLDEVKQKYQDYVDQQSDQYSTPEAKNFFNRQAARLGGTLLKNAVRGQAVVAGNNAKLDLQQTVMNNQGTLEKDPMQFADIHDSTLEYLDQKVQEGTISAADEPKFRQQINLELAKSALRGHMNVDPAQAKALIAGGAFDDYMSSDEKKQMMGEVHQHETAQLVEQERALRVKKMAQEEASDNWEQKALPLLVGNSLDSKAILNSPLSPERKYQWLGMMKNAGRENFQSNPAVVNNLKMRMLLPDGDPNKITDPGQIFPYVSQGEITPQDMLDANSWFDKTPQGEALNVNRKQLMDLAKSKLMPKSGGMMGVADPDGERNLMQFTSALQREEASYRQQGKPLSALYDASNSKEFFGNKLSQYEKTPQQIMEEMANKAKGSGQFQPGEVRNFKGTGPMKFKGGDPKDKANWEEVK